MRLYSSLVRTTMEIRSEMLTSWRVLRSVWSTSSSGHIRRSVTVLCRLGLVKGLCGCIDPGKRKLAPFCWRSVRTYRIPEWSIYLCNPDSRQNRATPAVTERTLSDCNQHYVTVEKTRNGEETYAQTMDGNLSNFEPEVACSNHSGCTI